MCVHMQVCAHKCRCLLRKEVLDPLGRAGAIDGWEKPVDARNQTQVLCKNSQFSYLLNRFSSPWFAYLHI